MATKKDIIIKKFLEYETEIKKIVNTSIIPSLEDIDVLNLLLYDWVDERPANDNARNGRNLSAGRISIQGHDPTTDLLFKNIRIVAVAAP